MRAAAGAALWALVATSCGGGESAAISDGGAGDGVAGEDGATGGPRLMPRNGREVVIPGASYHPLGTDLIGVFEVPAGASAAAPVPACVIVHGSGGLFREAALGEPCTDRVESNYEELFALLAEEGVAALAPSSFYSREPRFCEDNSAFIDYAPPGYNRDEHRIAIRTYDLYAATRFVCDRPEIDCDRLCFIGTSNGGSILFHYLHAHLEDSLPIFFAERAAAIGDVPYVPIPASRPLPRFAQAISPGCGLNGAIGLTSGATQLPQEPIEELYYPAPSTTLYMDLGSEDTVPAECAVAIGPGRRELQAAEVERRESISAADSRYRFTIHSGGVHDLLGQTPFGDTIRASFRDRVRGL